MNKVVLVTGGAQGIGKAIVLELAKNHYDVVINYLTSNKAAALLEEEIKKNYDVRVMTIQADVSKEEEVDAMISLIEKKWGGVDILVNNAAVDLSNLFHLKTADEFRKTLDVNVVGAFNCSKRVYRHMLDQEYGRIINISSTSGLYGTPKLATYCMSKWGILGLTKTLAKEVGSKGIIVNALCPTKVKTPMCETMEYVQFINDLTGKDFKSVEEMYNGVPFLDVEDISSMVYWLGTSREAGKFNGREVALDLGTLQ